MAKGIFLSKLSGRSRTTVENWLIREGAASGKPRRNALARLRRGTTSPFSRNPAKRTLSGTKQANVITQSRDGIKVTRMSLSKGELQSAAIHRNLVDKFLQTGDSTDLERFLANPRAGKAGKKLPKKISGHRLASDLDEMERLYNLDHDVFDPDDFYPEDDK